MTLIALVIGGNTTVFSILHGILTKPAPGVQAAGLVTLDLIVNGIPYNGGNSYPNYLDYAAQILTVQPLVVADYERFTLTVPNGSYALRGDLVSTNYFDTLGIRPIAGRAFIGGDDRAQASGLPTVVSERLWQRQFAAAPTCGRPGDRLERSFGDHHRRRAGTLRRRRTRRVGRYLGTDTSLRARAPDRTRRERSPTLRTWIFGRLTSGTSLAQARVELAAISRRLQAAYPDVNKGQVVFPIPYPPSRPAVCCRARATLLAIFSVITVLAAVIVCANVANLMLARAVARQRELALVNRSARHARASSACCGGRRAGVNGRMGGGVCRRDHRRALLAGLLPPNPWALRSTPTSRPTGSRRVRDDAGGPGTVAFTLAPAIRAWRQEVLPWLKAGEHGVVQGRWTLQRAGRDTARVLRGAVDGRQPRVPLALVADEPTDPGYKTDHFLLVSMRHGRERRNARGESPCRTVRERLRAIPGVGSISHARWTSGWSEQSGGAARTARTR